MKLTINIIAALFLLMGLSAPQDAAAQSYYAYVAAESEDEVALVRFDAEAQRATVAKTITVGQWPVETEGPHGLTVAPDGDHWYLSIAHGQPYGRVVKYATGTDRRLAEAELGLFPATMDISTATGLLYVVNFNLHGPMEPSTVSVVDPETMEEITQVETGVMPHGSRMSPDGQRQYSVAMMSGALYEIDAATFAVTRTLPTGEGQPKPTWVQPHPSKPLAYVANNGADEVVEVDLEDWTITRRFATGEGTKPYNLDVSPDGAQLVVTYKGSAETGIWDLSTGTETAVLDNTRRVTHGHARRRHHAGRALRFRHGRGHRRGAGRGGRDRSAGAAARRLCRDGQAGRRHRVLENGTGHGGEWGITKGNKGRSTLRLSMLRLDAINQESYPHNHPSDYAHAIVHPRVPVEVGERHRPG